MTTPKLLNLHEIVQEAAFKDEKKRPLEIGSYRVDAETHRLAAEILARNGLTPSAFARRCFERLVAEYGIEPSQT